MRNSIPAVGTWTVIVKQVLCMKYCRARNSRGPRGHWPPNFPNGPPVFMVGGQKGPLIFRTFYIYIYTFGGGGAKGPDENNRVSSPDIVYQLLSFIYIFPLISMYSLYGLFTTIKEPTVGRRTPPARLPELPSTPQPPADDRPLPAIKQYVRLIWVCLF